MRVVKRSRQKIRRNSQKSRGELFGAALVLILFLIPVQSRAIYNSDTVGPGFQEREAALKSRESGFGDLEIDLIHGSIARNLKKLTSFGDISLEEASYGDFMMGKDSKGLVYYRFRIREGDSFSNDVYPTHFLFRAHLYIYPPTGENVLDKIILQYYRINTTGSSYSHEIRRIVHPEPRDAVGEKDIYNEDFQLSSNSNLQMELYEEPSTAKPEWEGKDSVPLPVISLTPKESVKLNDPNDLLPYERQTKIMAAYKKLLRKADEIIKLRTRHKELDRSVKIGRIMDFPN